MPYGSGFGAAAIVLLLGVSYLLKRQDAHNLLLGVLLAGYGAGTLLALAGREAARPATILLLLAAMVLTLLSALGGDTEHSGRRRV